MIRLRWHLKNNSSFIQPKLKWSKGNNYTSLKVRASYMIKYDNFKKVYKTLIIFK